MNTEIITLDRHEAIQRGQVALQNMQSGELEKVKAGITDAQLLVHQIVLSVPRPKFDVMDYVGVGEDDLESFPFELDSKWKIQLLTQLEYFLTLTLFGLLQNVADESEGEFILRKIERLDFTVKPFLRRFWEIITEGTENEGKPPSELVKYIQKQIAGNMHSYFIGKYMAIFYKENGINILQEVEAMMRENRDIKRLRAITELYYKVRYEQVAKNEGWLH